MDSDSTWAMMNNYAVYCIHGPIVGGDGGGNEWCAGGRWVGASGRLCVAMYVVLSNDGLGLLGGWGRWYMGKLS